MRSARESASARATEHCGCVPVAEYDGLEQTGQMFRAEVSRATTGFFSLTVFSPFI